MQRRTKWIAGAALAAAVIAGGAGIAVASGAGRDDDQPITGEALDRATAAALEETGGGTVTDTEQGDEDGAYEVEVTLDDGTQVDVHLDEDFNVLGSDPDDDTGPDDDADDGDDDGDEAGEQDD